MFRCLPFTVGSLHDPRFKDFYIFCAQQLQKHDLGDCVSITMDHIIKGGVHVRDFMSDSPVSCRGEKLKIADVQGRLVETHNQSFLDLQDRLLPEINDYVHLEVLSVAGDIDKIDLKG